MYIYLFYDDRKKINISYHKVMKSIGPFQVLKCLYQNEIITFKKLLNLKNVKNIFTNYYLFVFVYNI